ncbi:hypothetical protein [Helicobacter pylori]|nr:hypothetical protein [Helicobacter pylori]
MNLAIVKYRRLYSVYLLCVCLLGARQTLFLGGFHCEMPPMRL